MRKLVAASLALLVLGGAHTGALAAKKKKKAAHQHVEGGVSIPQYAESQGCVYRSQRTLYSAAGDAINGIVGYTFEVDPATAGSKFQLDVSSGAGMDIQFYSDLGDPTDPTTAPGNVGFETAGPGGEAGTVPEGYPLAFVCLTEGPNATFTYKAGAGVK